MEKKADPKLIGIFVVGAVGLLVLGLVLFGSGNLFAQKNKMVLFFHGSVKGLNVGSPVVLRGVRVGSVVGITTLFDETHMKIDIPVIVEVDPAKIISADSGEEHLELYPYIARLVQDGLRARLQMQSIVTGQLMVELDIYPDTPIQLTGIDMGYPEIPTVPSPIETLSKTLKKYPLDDLIAKVFSMVDKVEAFISSGNAEEMVLNANESLLSMKKLVQNLAADLPPVIQRTEATLKDVQKLVRNVDRQVDPLAKDMEQSLETITAVLQQFSTTLADVKKTIGSDSALSYQFSKTLREAVAATRSIRVLVDYLQQHPDALLRGKANPGGE